jgi:hypothetical protein
LSTEKLDSENEIKCNKKANQKKEKEIKKEKKQEAGKKYISFNSSPWEVLL